MAGVGFCGMIGVLEAGLDKLCPHILGLDCFDSLYPADSRRTAALSDCVVEGQTMPQGRSLGALSCEEVWLRLREECGNTLRAPVMEEDED